MDGSFPVAGTSQFTQLFKNDSAVFISPFFRVFQKTIPSEIVLILALFAELLFHLCLGGNTRVIGTREPESIMALLPCPAGQNVLDCVVENMPHGQDTGHIGRGDDDGISGFFRIWFPTEGTLIFPGLVEAVLHIFWLVCFFHLLDRKRSIYLNLGIGE